MSLLSWLRQTATRTPLAYAQRIAAMLDDINETLKRMEIRMANIDTATSDLTALTDVGDGLVHLVTGLAADVRELKSHQTDPETGAKIDALAATMEAKTAEWRAALVANTPVAGGGDGNTPEPQAQASAPPIFDDQPTGA